MFFWAELRLWQEVKRVFRELRYSLQRRKFRLCETWLSLIKRVFKELISKARRVEESGYVPNCPLGPVKLPNCKRFCGNWLVVELAVRPKKTFWQITLVFASIGYIAIDLFTDTAAILNKSDLRSIIGCPGGMSAFRLYFRALFGTFFRKVFLE